MSGESDARLAGAAGSLLLRLRSEPGLTGRELGKRGDTESNVLLLRELAAARPDDAVLSEESKDTASRFSADRVWIIDPLDGGTPLTYNSQHPYLPDLLICRSDLATRILHEIKVAIRA